ncbi:MAG: glycosyl transferase family 2 [Proteobacteria bacterium SG_bin6]|nr:MAG: glycosyl transferase family 2 [Proteobacteria bacterium SG_bin6]
MNALLTPVAVCIVAFRDAAQIVQCLSALSASEFADYEVVICENGGPDAYAALCAAVPAQLAAGQAVTCLRAPGNLGYAGGVNQCMAARPMARAWWVLNPDTEVEPHTLGALLDRLDRGDCDAVGGILYHRRGHVQSCGGRWRPWLARAESLAGGTSLNQLPDARAIEQRMNYISGACMLIGRRFVATIGPMREDYFLYAEEIEWCLRAKAQGLRLGFAPAARLCHDQGGSTGSATAIRARPRLPIYLDERNKLLVVRDTTPWLLPVAAVASFALGAGRFARRGAWRQWLDAIEGWWAGLLGQRGVPRWLDAASKRD